MSAVDDARIANLFKFGDHTIDIDESTDVNIMQVVYSLFCRQCGSICRGYLNLYNINKSSATVYATLFNTFKRDVPESCEQAKLLGIINDVHER